MAKKYNEVTPEILEQFKAIVPGKVYAGEEINSDYFHDEIWARPRRISSQKPRMNRSCSEKPTILKKLIQT